MEPHTELTGEPHTELNGALELERVVPASGNLWLAGQQLWLGPGLAGRSIGIWVDVTSVHLSIDGHHLKTVPSRLSPLDLAKLAIAGARPASSPAPVRPALAPKAAHSTALEVCRTVNAAGLVGVAGRQVGVGSELAGRRVTLRIDGQVMQVIADGTLVRTVACLIPVDQRHRIQGARLAGPPPPPPEALRVERKVSSQGVIMVATQKICVGLPHAGTTVTVVAETEHFRVLSGEGEELVVVRRMTAKEVKRYKVHRRRNIV